MSFCIWLPIALLYGTIEKPSFCFVMSGRLFSPCRTIEFKHIVRKLLNSEFETQFNFYNWVGIEWARADHSLCVLLRELISPASNFVNSSTAPFNIAIPSVWLPKPENYHQVGKPELNNAPEVWKLRHSNFTHVRQTIWSNTSLFFYFNQTTVARVMDGHGLEPT